MTTDSPPGRVRNGAGDRRLASLPRVPPHDADAEAALVGAVLVRPEAAGELFAVVRPADFYDVSIANVVGAIETVVGDDDSPDELRVATELRRAGLLDGLHYEGAAGAAALVTIRSRGAMRSEIPQLARGVARDAQARRVSAQGERITAAGYAGDLDQAAAVAVEMTEALAGAGGVASSSWEPVDLEAVMNEDPRSSAPTMLRRSDGEALLYPGKSHAFNGAPESLKSLLAQYAAKERIDQGEHVVYLDFEDDPAGVVERMLALGTARADLVDRFHYVRPDSPFGAGARAQLLRLIRARQPALVVIDGVAEAMAQNGWNESDNADVAAFLTALVRLLEREGCCVVVIDHLVKDKEGQGRYARGAGHKLAGLSGAAYKLEVTSPFGRGKSGAVRLSVMKDRPGWVRRAAAGSRAGDIAVSSTEDGAAITLVVKAPEAATSGPFRPTILMEHVSRVLEVATGPLTQARVLEATRGNRDYRITALRCLVDEGFVERTKEGQSHLHRSVTPFRQPSVEPVGEPLEPPGPDRDADPEQGTWEDF